MPERQRKSWGYFRQVCAYDRGGRPLCMLCGKCFRTTDGQIVATGSRLPVPLCERCMVDCEYDPHTVQRALVREYRRLRAQSIEQRGADWLQHLHRVRVGLFRLQHNQGVKSQD